MVYRERIQNGELVLDSTPQLPEGTAVQVEIHAMNGLRRGSPAALLRLAGTLSDSEAVVLERSAEACRRIDSELSERGQ